MRKIMYFSPYSLGFLLSCIFICINATQSHYLIIDLKFTIIQSDWLTSTYLLGNFLGLFPVWIFLDRYPAKYVFSAFFIFSGIGLLLFGFSSNLYVLIFSRFVAGFGASVALMAAFKVNAELFLNKLATINGVTMFMGGIGGFIAGKPLQFFFSHYGWRLCNITLSLLVFTSILLAFALDKRILTPLNKSKFLFFRQICDLKIIFREKIFISLCFLVIVPFGMLISMFTFWTSQWLAHVNYFTISSVAICVSMMAIADFIGPLFWGVIADAFHKRGVRFETIILCGITISIIVQILVILNIANAIGNYLLWFFFVFATQASSLGFVVSSGIFTKDCIGRAITSLEILIFTAAFIIQLSFSYIIKMFNYFGTSIPNSYSYTLGFFLIIEVICCLVFVLRKNTKSP